MHAQRSWFLILSIQKSPNANISTVPVTVSHDQLFILGKNMSGIKRKAITDIGTMIQIHGTQYLFSCFMPVISDPFAVGIPVFVSNHLPITAGMQFAYLTGADSAQPQPMVNHIPVTFMTECQQIRVCGRRIYMGNEISLFPNHLCRATANGNPKDLAEWLCITNLLKTSISGKIILTCFIDGSQNILAVRSNGGNMMKKALRHPVNLP